MSIKDKLLALSSEVLIASETKIKQLSHKVAETRSREAEKRRVQLFVHVDEGLEAFMPRIQAHISNVNPDLILTHGSAAKDLAPWAEQRGTPMQSVFGERVDRALIFAWSNSEPALDVVSRLRPDIAPTYVVFN